MTKDCSTASGPGPGPPGAGAAVASGPAIGWIDSRARGSAWPSTGATGSGGPAGSAGFDSGAEVPREAPPQPRGGFRRGCLAPPPAPAAPARLAGPPRQADAASASRPAGPPGFGSPGLTGWSGMVGRRWGWASGRSSVRAAPEAGSSPVGAGVVASGASGGGADERGDGQGLAGRWPRFRRPRFRPRLQGRWPRRRGRGHARGRFRCGRGRPGEPADGGGAVRPGFAKA